MVAPLRVRFDLRAVEVDVSEITGAVSRRLVVEMWRRGVAALAARGYGLGADAVAELDDGDEAVPARSIDLLRSPVRPRAERRERAPSRRRERDGDAGPRVREGVLDVVGEALEAIDVPPRRLPGAEAGGERVGRRGEREYQL